VSISSRLLVSAICLLAPAVARSADTDTVQEYAAKCDMAIGVTVRDFVCDNGTDVPMTNPSNTRCPVEPGVTREKPCTCDRPNVLNSECDPGSRFQVLDDNGDAFAVAHCRKRGHKAGVFDDIAVIQHNRKTGATCFYQALRAFQPTNDPLDGNVQAPGKQASPADDQFWMQPAKIAGSGFPCGRCHDNGAIIRSPYLTQLGLNNAPNILPGSQDDTFNSDDPYYFVGTDFAPWIAYKVEIPGHKCNECHRLGVNNVGNVPMSGTARDFAFQATADAQTSKNPHSPQSPIWMLRDQITFDQQIHDFALQIRDCGATFPASSPGNCTITQFTGPPGAPPALSLGGQVASDPAVAKNQDGRLEAFVVGPDQALWHIAQISPYGPWSDWSKLDGNLAGNPVVGVNADGRLEVFVRGSDNALWHNWQVSPGGDWAGWASLGGLLAGEPVVDSNLDGRLEVFAWGFDRALWHNWQVAPNGDWSGWATLQGELTSDPVVARNDDGRLEVFGRGLDNALWHIWQTAPNNGWSDWASLAGTVTDDYTVAANADGRLEVFARATDGSLWHNWQVSPSGGWSGWAASGGVLASKIAVGRNIDGGLEVFARGTDLALWHNRQNRSQWSGWWSLGGQLPGNVVVGHNNSGRPVVFVRGTDNALWHN
jgi:hypothetical protein